MDRRARQGRVGRRRGEVALVGELVLHQRRLLGAQVRHDDRDGLAPPRQAAQVRLGRREVARRRVQAREHRADAGAVVGVGSEVVLAGKAVDDGRGLAGEREHERAARVGVRARHRQRVLGVVLHQLQVERQLVGAQALEDA